MNSQKQDQEQEHFASGREATISFISPEISPLSESTLSSLVLSMGANVVGAKNLPNYEKGNLKFEGNFLALSESHLLQLYITPNNMSVDKRAIIFLATFTCGEARPQEIHDLDNSWMSEFRKPSVLESDRYYFDNRGSITRADINLGNYLLVEIQGLSKKVLNSRADMEALSKAAVIIPSSSSPTSTYSFEFREDMVKGSGEVAGYTGYGFQSGRLFAYHGYPDEDKLLVTMHAHELVNPRRLVDRLIAFNNQELGRREDIYVSLESKTMNTLLTTQAEALTRAKKHPLYKASLMNSKSSL